MVFRYFFLVFIASTLVIVSVAGFRGMKSPNRPIQIFPDMDDQPKYRPQHASTFFADGREARPPVEGTVPIGYNLEGFYYTSAASNSRVVQKVEDFSAGPDYLSTGKMNGFWGDGIPIEVNSGVMARGRERFNINCAICHGATAAGNGLIKQYGLTTIASLQDDRIKQMPDGEIFNTITHGKNTMNAYGPNIAVEDRWAIIAYLRALQRSQGGTIDDVPPEQRAALDQPAGGGTAQ